MKRALEQVRQFQDAFGHPVLENPSFPDEARRQLRRELLLEEFLEYRGAEQENDLVDVADALADMVYIILGTALEYGLPLDRVFDAVHAANMAKLGPDGKPLKRPDGKVIKPAGWQPPDIGEVLRANREPAGIVYSHKNSESI